MDAEFGVSCDMLSTQELLTILAGRRIKSPELAACLGLVPGAGDRILAGTRRLKLDEAKKLIDTFGLEPVSPVGSLSLDIARVLILHAARTLRVKLNPNDAQIEELVRDFRSVTTDPLLSENAEAAENFLRGLGRATEIAESD